MQRRHALRFLGAALALPFLPRDADAAIALGESVHRQAGKHRENGEAQFRTLNPQQQALVTDIAELIIPETDTPGATSVHVPEFIDLILSEWASDEEKKAFLAGLGDIDARASTLGVARFVDLRPTQKTELLTAWDASRADKTGAAHAFGRLKSLTIFGYFTSKPVQSLVLKTRIFFDGYQGNVPFSPAT